VFGTDAASSRASVRKPAACAYDALIAAGAITYGSRYRAAIRQS
jgi:hypothetical protein